MHATSDNARVHEVLDWCTDSYLRHGRKLTLPTNTDPTKTYQWRYAASLAKKFAEWEFDEETSKRFIDIAVDYSKSSRTLNKGLAALHQGNILNVCYERLKGESNRNVQIGDLLTHTHNWLRQKVDGRDLLAALLQREIIGGYCNITAWYQATKLPPLYLALSRACWQALAILERENDEERQMLPKRTSLFITRSDFLNSVGDVSPYRELLAADWRQQCQLPS